MQRAVRSILALVLALAGLGAVLIAGRYWWQHAPGPVIPFDAAYDERTMIARSFIPGAGQGVFARTRIAAGETIGELGGRLLRHAPEGAAGDHVFILADCAVDRYRFLDSSQLGGHVSRINFSPRLINGRETGFQNARYVRTCKPPYVVFIATRDIEPGAEIYASYGTRYNYAPFMDAPAVRGYFCGLLQTDCRDRYDYEP